MTTPMILVSGLTKSFGEVRALTGVDLEVEEGTVYALLGPNGAGKTTAVRILTTLLQPDGGTANVAGFDITTQAAQLRCAIGLAGQYAAVDEILTGLENLEMVGRLYGMRKTEARQRAGDILERFDLSDAADRRVRTYSGGMRRRLDLAASLVAQPTVIFLDEPTTGLDIRSRIGLWDFIEHLVDEGATLMLTTQYLEEADRLADRIGVIDKGHLIAEGTSTELKEKVGGDVIEIEVADRAHVMAAAAAVKGVGTERPRIDEQEGRVRIPVSSPVGVITETVRKLDAAGIKLRDLAIRRPTLDDVFLTLTGSAIEAEAAANAKARTSRRKGRR